MYIFLFFSILIPLKVIIYNHSQDFCRKNYYIYISKIYFMILWKNFWSCALELQLCWWIFCGYLVAEEKQHFYVCLFSEEFYHNLFKLINIRICCQAYFSAVVAVQESAVPTLTVTMINGLMLAKGSSLASFSPPSSLRPCLALSALSSQTIIPSLGGLTWQKGWILVLMMLGTTLSIRVTV